jgi:hypothetical protein
MKLHGYRCDTCLKEQPLSLLLADGVPPGWLTVKRSALFLAPAWTFCSWRCLYQWSSNQYREECERESEASV